MTGRFPKSSVCSLFFMTVIIWVVFPLVRPAAAIGRKHEDFRFRRYSLEQGLSQGNAYCIAQDRRGFIWIGTQDGLNRFDGSRFLVFNHDPFDSTSLSHNKITSLHADREGNLWVGTCRGLNLLELGHTGFKRFLRDPADSSSLICNEVHCLFRDRRGWLWIGTRNGLDRLEPATGRFKHFLHSPVDSTSLTHPEITNIYEDEDGTIWVGTQRGMNRFDARNGGWDRFYPGGSENEDLPTNQISAVYEIGDGLFLIGTWAGLYRFDSNSGHFSRSSLLDEQGRPIERSIIRGIVKDRDGRFWLATFNQGIVIFRLDSDRIHRIRNHPLDPTSLSDDSILCLFEDGGEVIWAGTNGYGLNAWSPFLQKFECHAHDPVDSDTPSFKSFRSIYEDPGGTVWIAGYGGFNKFDPATGRFTALPVDDLEAIRVIQGDPDSPSGVLWLGTEGSGLVRYDVAARSKRVYPQSSPGKNGLTGSFVFSICPDRTGRLWIGTDQGLNLFDRLSGEFTLCHPFEGCTDSHVVTVDSVGTLWVGSSGGLARFDQRQQEFIRYHHDPADPTSLSSNYIMCIYRDRSGKVWIGTNGGGLNRFEPDSGTFVRYLMTAGLPNNVVYGVLEDDQGDLWLSTNAGISRFDPESETFRNFTTVEGLQGLEFNAGAYHRGPSGNLYFGGVNGFNIIRPGGIPVDPHSPPVVITDFQLFNKSVTPAAWRDGRRILSKSITETKLLDLSHKDRVISFELAALNFSNPDRNTFAYRLDGLDMAWNEIGTRKFITFAELKPGRYRLRVRAANADGVWNESGGSVNLRISPPFWRAWWFQTLGLLLLATGALGLHFRRLRIMKKHNIELNRAIEFLDSIINGIDDPVFVKDMRHRWVAMNDTYCELVGLPREQLIGKSDYDLFPREKADWFWKKDDEVMSTGRSITFEAVVELRGSQHVISIKKSVFTERTSGRRFVAGTIRDVTEHKRAEQVIKDNEARLQSIFRASPAGIVLVVNDMFREINDRFCEMLGYRPEELLDQNIRVLFPSEDEFNEAGRFMTEQVKRSGQGSTEVRLKKKNGKLINCFISLSPIDSQNPEAGWIFAALDISDRKMMEHVLRLTSFAVDRGASIGIWMTRNGDIVYVNDTACRSLGYSHDELLAMNIFDIVGNPEEMRKMWTDLWANLKAKGSLTVERVARTKAGDTFPVEITCNYIEFEGKEYNCAFGTNISERRRAFEALREQQQKYSTILENINIGVALVSPDLQLLETNERMRSWFPHIVTTQKPICFELCKDPPQNSAGVDCPVVKTLADGGVHEFVSETRRADGISLFRIVASPIKDAEGNVVAAIQMVEDITEKQRLEEQLWQAQKMEAIGTLAGGIAHDFNNILYAQLGYAKLAKRELAADSKPYQYIEMIETAGQRATDLVKQILTINRQSGEGRRPVRLPVVLKEVTGLLRGSLPATVEIKSRVEPGCGDIMAEPTKIHQVLMNLCTNAFQAMPERRGILEIELREVMVDEAVAASIQGLETGPHARITVRDDGIGMDKDTMKRIFIPYFTTKPPGEGTGLGLATTHGIIKSFGGAVHVESKPGQGSKFEVYFPIVRQESGSSVAKAVEVETVGARARILFVDDEPMITRMCDTALTEAGFIVTACTESMVALEEYKSNPARFDIVITDVTMPTLTGVDLAKAMRLIRSDIPIIICTGYSEAFDMSWAESFGIQDFIWKPVRLENLINCIRQVLKREKTVEV